MDRLAIKQLILTVAIIVFATLAVIDGAKQALAQVGFCGACLAGRGAYHRL